MIKSPLNYIGGKRKLLPQILPLFPKDIDTFVDLFAGGCNVGINVDANKVIFNDNLTYLIDMYQSFKNHTVEQVLDHIEGRVIELDLSLTNQEGYLKLREEYNEDRDPLDLFVLTAFSFNHQIRFNNSHKFNNPFGKNRSSFNSNMKKNLLSFLEVIKQDNYQFQSLSYDEFDFTNLSGNDLVYCDPPYLITTGTYNDGKRGFKGWGEHEEDKLLSLLDNLNEKGIRFALSNVLEHKGKENLLLKKWLEDNSYYCHELNHSYANSSYKTTNRKKNSSKEVLITNY